MKIHAVETDLKKHFSIPRRTKFSNLLKKPRILGAYIFQGAIVALVAIASCLTMLLFVEAGVPLLLAMATHVLPVAWASAAVSVCVSIWLTRRVLRNFLSRSVKLPKYENLCVES